MEQVKKWIQEADAILVGIGSGMSSSAGYNHYHHNFFFEEHFSDFEEQYGFRNLFKGFYHVYPTPEQQWAYYAKYIHVMQEEPAGSVYQNLKKCLEGKEYYILTTNVDIQLPKVFPEEKVFHFQGDFRYMQCCQPCHDAIYPTKELVKKMVEQTKELKVPEELVPRCPKCGWKMVPWVQDDTFLRGKDWQEKQEEYHAFLRKYKDKKLLLLQLGVGEMTPAVIKYPFWDMTEKQKDTRLIVVNLQKEKLPEYLKEDSMEIQMDIREFFLTLL